MLVKRHIKSLPPILALTMSWSLPAVAAPAGDLGSPSVSDVSGWAPLSMREFLTKAKVAPTTTISAPSAVPSVTAGLDAAGVARVEVGAATIVGQDATPPQASPELSSSTIATDELRLNIAETPNGLVFTPEHLVFRKIGQKAALQISVGGADLALFVRDQKILSLRKGDGQLVGVKAGVTELYAFAKGRMYIVPVAVMGKAKTNKWDVQVPKDLLSLNGVLPATTGSAHYSGLAQATALPSENPGQAVALTASNEPAAASADLPPEALVTAEQPAVAGAPGASPASDSLAASAASAEKGPSLNESVAETTQAMIRQAKEAQRFYNAKDRVSYRAVTLQIIDDRSDPEAGKIFPVAGATVRVLGTEFAAQTDATGHLTINDMPRKSRFLVRIDDSTGQIRPALAELTTHGDKVIRIRTLRNLVFDAVSNIAGSVQQTSLGSYCGTVTDFADGRKHAPVMGAGVQLDMNAEGPFYFNGYGFLDRSMNSTGPDGRFCYFNATPGPAGITVYRDQAPVTTMAVSIFAGRHVEDDLSLGGEHPLALHLASMATAQEQLSSDAAAAQGYKQVGMIDMLPFGSQEPMMQVGPGQIATADPILGNHGRQRVYARAAEFEPAVYSFNADDEQKVTPLIPHGFIEDMSFYAQVSHNPELGSVLAEYSAPEGATKETIAMRLIDQEGRDAGDGWYYSDAPLTRAIFFNVPAGTYSLQVQTRDGYWLSSDTVIVYNETTSFVRLGNSLRYQTPGASGAKSS